jgi:hypothetical protein
VVDGPAIAVRGYMLDVSRDRVPTRDTLSRLVELLALARYNHFELYVEHPFEFAGHEVVWKDASPLTGDDLEWLDHLCAEHGIDLVVNQNTFGHMGRWLAHDEYRWRAECPDGFEIVDGVAMPPSLLAPTPDNAEFALGLVRQQRAGRGRTWQRCGVRRAPHAPRRAADRRRPPRVVLGRHRRPPPRGPRRLAGRLDDRAGVAVRGAI